MILQVLFTIGFTFLYVAGMMVFWTPKNLKVDTIKYYSPFKEKVFQTKAVGDAGSSYAWQVHYTNDNWASYKVLQMFDDRPFSLNNSSRITNLNTKQECIKISCSLKSWEEAEQYSRESEIKDSKVERKEPVESAPKKIVKQEIKCQ